jgi:hypothetical protein
LPFCTIPVAIPGAPIGTSWVATESSARIIDGESCAQTVQYRNKAMIKNTTRIGFNFSKNGTAKVGDGPKSGFET